jgi:hypothetical protein
MRALVWSWIVCAGVADAGVGLAAPRVNPQDRYELAEQQFRRGEHEQALATIAEGLAAAPKDRPLLKLKGTVLLRMDAPGVLDAYQALLDAGVTGSEKVAAEQIIDYLKPRGTTFLEITVANGPADVYVDQRARGVFCRAAPSCKKALAPGKRKVTVERAGFRLWTDRVPVAAGTTAPLAVTLTELASTLTVRVAQPGASVTVDGAAHDAPATIDAGPHEVVVALEGYETAHLEAVAKEGKPIDLDITLVRIVPVYVEPAGAQLWLDGKQVSIEAGGIPMTPGAHGLEVRASGFHTRKIAVPAEPGPDYRIGVELRAIEQVVAPRPGRFTPRRRLAVAAGALGLAAVGTGVVLGRQARQLQANALTVCPSPSSPCSFARQANDFNQRGRSRARQANVAFGVAGGAAVAAGILWLTGAPESRVAVTPHLGAVAGLDLAVRF